MPGTAVLGCRAVVGPPRLAVRSRRAVRVRRVRARQTAMTLLEVILAIAILGGSLAVLGELVRAGSRAARHAKMLSIAQLLADSLTAEVCIGGTTPESTEGVVDDYGGSSWSYSLQVEQVEQQGLLAVMVTVHENVDLAQQPISYSLVRWMIDPQTELDMENAAAEAEAAAGSSGSSSSGSSDTSGSGADTSGAATGGGR